MQRILLGSLVFVVGAGVGALISGAFENRPDSRVLRQSAAEGREAELSLKVASEGLPQCATEEARVYLRVRGTAS